jgi:DnaJ-domain-containing protein 1
VPDALRRPPWVQAEAPPPGPDEAAPDPGPPERPERPQQPEQPEQPERLPPEAPASDETPLDALAALEVLGLGPTADAESIERAFRERSRTCHPDKVAHLDAEFQALAERKFRRLRAAYELLRA